MGCLRGGPCLFLISVESSGFRPFKSLLTYVAHLNSHRAMHAPDLVIDTHVAYCGLWEAGIEIIAQEN
jgi:hypothetical protein